MEGLVKRPTGPCSERWHVVSPLVTAVVLGGVRRMTRTTSGHDNAVQIIVLISGVC